MENPCPARAGAFALAVVFHRLLMKKAQARLFVQLLERQPHGLRARQG